MEGRVKAWLSDKGYGFITADDHRDVFVHHTGIGGDGMKSLVPGESVRFEIVDGQKGPQAVDVLRLGSANDGGTVYSTPAVEAGPTVNEVHRVAVPSERAADVLKLVERVQLAVELGESHFREFKSAFDGPPGDKRARDKKSICVDIAQTLVAFANADGGELLVGVEDDSTVTGLPFDGDEIAVLQNAPISHVHSDTPLPAPYVAKVDFDDRLILYFSVPKGSDFVYVTSDGRCLQRKDRSSQPIASESIKFSRQETSSREYDRLFVDGATLADLNRNLVGQLAEHISKGMSVEKCLQHLGLAEYDGARLRLRKAALLLFARQPHRWHPRLQVRVVKIEGTELKTGEDYNVTYDEEVSNNVLSLLEASWEMIRPRLTETRFHRDARFRDQIMYPELACREALVNAVAHRDYSVEGRGIEVRIFTDRLEIASPGGLLSSIRLEDLRQSKGVHQSRNSLITRVLRERGYMRELGEGLPRIFDLMQGSDLEPPELVAENDLFVIKLHHKYIYTREEKLWLEGFDRFELSREQKAVVLLGYNGHIVSAKEIWDRVGIVDTDYYRKLVESLRKLGILSRVVTKAQQQSIAKCQRIPTKQVPQFAISLPGPAGSVRSRSSAVDNVDYAKVFVGNVPNATTTAHLLEVFGSIGRVVDISIPVDRETGRIRGFAFVEFERTEDARRALALSGKLQLFGQILYVQVFRSSN